jgi:hypothetical protein
MFIVQYYICFSGYFENNLKTTACFVVRPQVAAAEL